MSMPLKCQFIILLISFGSLTGCSNSSNNQEDQALTQNVPVIVYDETVDGPLPYRLSGLTNEEIANYTFTLIEGVNIVKGTSSSGESFVIDIPNGYFLKSITTTFSTHIDSNDHGIIIDYQATQILWDFYNMPTIGTYEHIINIPNTNIGGGKFIVYSGTSVQGASNENPYSISLEIAPIT